MGREGCKQNARRAAVSQRTQPAQGKAFRRLLLTPSYPDEAAVKKKKASLLFGGKKKNIKMSCAEFPLLPRF